MKSHSIIKWRLIWINIWVLGILYLIIYIGESQILGTYYSAWVFGGFQIAFGVYYFLKTRVYQFILLGFFLGTGFWHYEAAEHMDTIFSMKTFYVHLLAYFTIIFFAMPTITKAYKLESHARKLFKLAAETVQDSTNGFTARPYSGGKLQYTSDDVIGLARFLAGKEILKYRIENESILYGFSMNTSPLVDSSFENISSVSFGKDGEVSVRISAKDYKQYRKKLSFDQLCESFVRIFKAYIQSYQNNNENRIINELKSI